MPLPVVITVQLPAPIQSHCHEPLAFVWLLSKAQPLWLAVTTTQTTITLRRTFHMTLPLHLMSVPSRRYDELGDLKNVFDVKAHLN
jgi:hypothetical protein